MYQLKCNITVSLSLAHSLSMYSTFLLGVAPLGGTAHSHSRTHHILRPAHTLGVLVYTV